MATDTDDGLTLGGRFLVERLGDVTGKHRDCWFFVLDLDHDSHAVAALRAYADSVEPDFPVLAHQLRTKAAEAEERSKEDGSHGAN